MDGTETRSVQFARVDGDPIFVFLLLMNIIGDFI